MSKIKLNKGFPSFFNNEIWEANIILMVIVMLHCLLQLSPQAWSDHVIILSLHAHDTAMFTFLLSVLDAIGQHNTKSLKERYVCFYYLILHTNEIGIFHEVMWIIIGYTDDLFYSTMNLILNLSQ